MASRTIDSNFKAWFEYADMPEKDRDGRWFDLEDGLLYDPNHCYIPTKSRSKKVITPREQELIKTRKEFGGKALKGTAAQKSWAEKIRAEKIVKMSAEDAKLCCNPAGLYTHSKFWIENRDKSAEEIAKMANKAEELANIARKKEEELAAGRDFWQKKKDAESEEYKKDPIAAKLKFIVRQTSFRPEKPSIFCG